MSVQQMPVAQPNPIRIFETIQGYQRAFALKAAIDLDLFTAIARGKHTAPEIATACQASERGVRMLSDAMVVLGFLTKAGNRYSLTADTAFFLDREAPAYLGRAFSFLMHPAQLTVSRSWGRRYSAAEQLKKKERWLLKTRSGWSLRAAWRR